MSEANRSAGAFVDALEHASSLHEIEAVFLAATAHLGFEHAALFNCLTPARESGAISFARIPADWLSYYAERRYHEIDPIFPAIRRRLTPFSWSDPVNRQSLSGAQKALLAECDTAGLTRGLVIPIKGPNAPLGCCMLGSGHNAVDPESFLVAHSLGVFAYACALRNMNEAVAAPAKLSKRERECLLLAAQGKSDWAIGEVLGLSERTVHHAIERAKRRYGTATRVQAVVQAIAAGEFCATDALG